MSQRRVLIFGSTGYIGGCLYEYFAHVLQHKTTVVCGVYEGHGAGHDANSAHCNFDNISELVAVEPFDAVIWAQGANINDNIHDFDTAEFSKIMDANVTFILETMQFLLSNNKIARSANLVIISSIWETNVRTNKLSYSISKAALSSLVKSAAADLSRLGIRINNVLPSVIDNEMTRRTMSAEQIQRIKMSTGFERLIDIEDIRVLVKFLVLNNTGISGQSIKVDLGMTNITAI